MISESLIIEVELLEDKLIPILGEEYLDQLRSEYYVSVMNEYKLFSDEVKQTAFTNRYFTHLMDLYKVKTGLDCVPVLEEL